MNLTYTQSNSEYVIFTTSVYDEAANIISNIHSSDVPKQYQLTTEIVFLDEFEWYDVSDPNLNIYIREEVLNQGDNLKYLLLLGNEVTIPPIYIETSSGYQPSDDFYSCEDAITTFTELNNFIPKVSTGRISVNNSMQANIVAEKLYQYMVNPTYGAWRSKIGLIADDENKNGYSRIELNHTINSNSIYNNMSNSLNVSQFYGVNYEPIENSTYIINPQMTSDVIDYINQGVSLINYIGHGSETTLGSEKIIDMERDLNHICNTGTPCNSLNKHAIWVVGTCSFGKYDESDEIMSEKLLFNNSGAISLVTTSRGIGAYTNSIYLNNFFNNINDFIMTKENNNRIGDIVRESKRIGQNTEYLFHLLGDPGLILPFPKKITDNSIIGMSTCVEDPTIECISHIDCENEGLNNTSCEILEGFEIMQNITDDLYENGLNTTMYENINIALTSKEISFQDSYIDTNITYTLKGSQIHTGIISENTCINIPLDIETCTDCSTVDVTLFSDSTSTGNLLYNGSIQIIKGIPVHLDNNFENDNTGPNILLSQRNTLIGDGSMINKNLELTISIEDPQGVNLMKDFQHNVRYWFNNDNNNIYSINSNLFEYEKDACGKISADFLITAIDIPSGNNMISIEAWDNGNNRTLIEYDFMLQESEESYVEHLYNFPNPFKNNTFFTFYLSKYPADVEINIYTVYGEKIKTLNQYCNNYYNVLNWDGKGDAGQELSNGPYIYSFKSIYRDIYGIDHHYKSINKIAKLK